MVHFFDLQTNYFVGEELLPEQELDQCPKTDYDQHFEVPLWRTFIR